MTVLVVMGVSGTGKTTVAKQLQDRLGWAFQEGDDLHSPDAVAKMRGGTPLNDADRAPWLRRVARVIDDWRARQQNGIITCSALKRVYRQVLIGRRPDVRLVYLTAPRSLLECRLASRKGHYMPARLLGSQLATLEPPGPDEHPITVDVTPPPAAIVDTILAALRGGQIPA